MGSVIERTSFWARHSRTKLIYACIGAVYFIAGFAFVTIGLQPIKNANDTYAAEAESATEILTIDSINLSAPVKPVMLNGKTLEVPEQIAGAYSTYAKKTLIIGHSSTVFKNLNVVKTGEKISYNGKTYTITVIEEKLKQDISMSEILESPTDDIDTLVLMTCSGEKIEGSSSDHTHRLIVTAKLQ